MRRLFTAFCALVAIAGIFWSCSRTRPPRPLVSSTERPPKIESCGECHSELVRQFQSSPHNSALTQPSGEVARRFTAAESLTAGVHFVERDGRLVAQSEENSLHVDWIFGSGRHAQTPVSVLTGPDGRLELIEHRVSWYPDGGLAPTLNLPPESPAIDSGLQTFGALHGPSAAQECFSCHSSHLIHEVGRPPHDVITGVGCVRCHVRAGEHLLAIENDVLSIDRWSDLSPLESINRCGECHRRADHFTSDELVPENPSLARFAPVGLSLSACFRRQDELSHRNGKRRRLDCMTCHDPHVAASRTGKAYRDACVTCHGSSNRDAPECSVETTDSNCIPCHMRKVPANDMLQFTDHWIR